MVVLERYDCLWVCMCVCHVDVFHPSDWVDHHLIFDQYVVKSCPLVNVCESENTPNKLRLAGCSVGNMMCTSILVASCQSLCCIFHFVTRSWFQCQCNWHPFFSYSYLVIIAVVLDPVWVPGLRIDPLRLLAGCRKRRLTRHPSTSAASSDYWWWSGVKEGTLTQLL